MTRYYLYRFEDEHFGYYTPQEAKEYSLLKKSRITRNGYEASVNSIRRVKDSFQPGFDPSLGMYFSSKRDRDRVIREKGLIEIGNEKLPANIQKENPYITPSDIKQFKSMGAEISDREADKLCSDSSLC